MAVLECKICGGMNEMFPGVALMPCRFCGSQMTLPLMKDENHAAAFNRGNHFRRIGEFDRALAVYERIVQEDETNAEAHWCCALCRFGIEYVQDPASGAYLPTCHRASYDSFLDDVDYLAALEHADETARRQYQQDAEQIARVQRGILAVSQSEKPFDVFICYKETGADGQRTHDSQLAQDIYYQLTDQGLRVFFARITLEDKAGTQYEPYIFAALNSAKVMVVVGTDPAHMNAPWVRNEWSRFLALMKRDRSRLLIPCYRDMDPYDMPEQLSILQSYDMSRIGFIQDLVRGIRKVVGEEKSAAPQAQSAAAPQAAPSTEPLLRRIALFLEDGDWHSADEYCERVLDIDPENAQAYLGKLMAALHVTRQEKLKDQAQPFDGNPSYAKALRFADEELAGELRGMIAYINERNIEAAYSDAMQTLVNAKAEQDYINARYMFESLGGWRDAATKAQECETKRKDWLYQQAEHVYAAATTEQDFANARKQFDALGSWRDAPARAQECETKRKDLLYLQAEHALAAAKTEQDFANARKQFDALGSWRDAAEKVQECETKRKDLLYLQAEHALAAANFANARKQFDALGNWRDAPARAQECETKRKDYIYNAAMNLMRGTPSLNACKQAISLLQNIPDWRDTQQQIKVCRQRIRDIEAAEQARKEARLAFMRASGRHIISVGGLHTAGLQTESTNDLKPRRGGFSKLFSILRSRTPVVAFGLNDDGQCNVSSWTDVVAIAAGGYHTVGLRADGSVVAVGRINWGPCNVSSWTDVVAIAAGGHHTVGLRADGSVAAVGWLGNGQCNVSGWTDVVAVAAGTNNTVGLRADGSVVAVGNNENGQCNVTGWTDIVAIAAGAIHTVGLRADGSVVAVGHNDYGQCNVSGWRDVVDIAAGSDQTVGLRSDGTVVAVGDNSFGQCDVSGWQLKQVPRPTLPE